jgi:hypothetical protein
MSIVDAFFDQENLEAGGLKIKDNFEPRGRNGRHQIKPTKED